MDRLFIISIIGLFSLLILNVVVIVKNDIKESEKKELNQKIENSIIQPLNTFEKESTKTKKEKELNHRLLEQKARFA